jgi:hypothetical protein
MWHVTPGQGIAHHVAAHYEFGNSPNEKTVSFHTKTTISVGVNI